MPGLGKKTWSALDVLTAADVNGYLMDQTVMKFAGTAARSSAIGTALSAGMVSFRTDGTVWEGYNGTAWGSLVDTTTFLTASSTATLTNKSIDQSQLVTTVNTVAATATTYLASAGDRNETIYSLATAAMTITVPDLFNIGDRIDVIRDAAGTVIMAAGTGVTSWAGAGTAGTAVTFKIDQQYNGATIQKVAANSYRVIGKITV
jgi:hypothetical protein